MALPERHRHTARAFDHYVPSVNRIEGAEIRVFLGSLAGRTSPIPTFTPLLGAEIVLGPDAHMSLGVDPRFEHGVLVDTGDVDGRGHPRPRGGAGLRRHRRALPDVEQPRPRRRPGSSCSAAPRSTKRS